MWCYPTTSVPAEATITSFDKLSHTHSPKYHGKEGTSRMDNGTNRTVCKMCPDIQKHSMKNARILFIVKSEFLGYNAHNLPIPDLDKEVNVQLNILTTLSPSQHCPHILPTALPDMVNILHMLTKCGCEDMMLIYRWGN